MPGQNPGEQSETAAADRLFSALATERSRGVVDYFRESGDTVASTEELAAHVADRQPVADRPRSEHVAVRLHHFDLPKLADADVLEYDPRSRTVRFRGHPLLEEGEALHRFADPDGTV